MVNKKSIVTNSLANYTGQLYVMVIGIALTPLFIKELGAESFGLIGFFTLLHTWLSLLDSGLSPAFSREIVKLRTNTKGEKKGFEVFQSFECVFVIIALVIIGLVSFTLNNYIATGWLNSSSLPINTVVQSIACMGIISGVRLLSSLYRSVFIGFEDQVLLNAFNIIFSTLKFVVGYLLVKYLDFGILEYFYFQVFVSIVETIFLRLRVITLIEEIAKKTRLVYFNYELIRPALPFSFSIAYTTVLWVFSSQIDKLIMSRVLSLEDFGYFTLIVLVSTALLQMTAPIGKALQPRFTAYYVNGLLRELKDMFKLSSQFIVLISFAISISVSVNAVELVYAWTGDTAAAVWAGSILPYYMLGNSFLACSALVYYIQVAKGEMSFHVKISTAIALIDIPVMALMAIYFGPKGAGIAWLILRAFWFFTTSYIVLKEFLNNEYYIWIFRCVIKIIIAVSVSVFFMQNINYVGMQQERPSIIFNLMLNGLGVIILSSLSTNLYTQFAKINRRHNCEK